MDSNITVESTDKCMAKLRHDVKDDLKKLSELKFGRGFLQVIFDWSLIIGSIALAKSTETIFTTLMALFIIGSRQHALLSLMHESAHFRLFKSRFWNDAIGNLFAAYPIFWDMYGYRENHFQHHKYVNTEKDPDWQRKVDHPDWKFPNSKDYVRRLFARYLYGFALLENFRFSLVMSGHWPAQKLQRKGQIPTLLQKLLYYGAIVGALAYAGALTEFAVYWLIPYYFIFPFIQKFRSIAEHFALPYTHELNQTRNVITNPIEAFFFGPHNLNYHLDHHLFPTVPNYNLPAFNKILKQHDTYQRLAFHNTSYVIPSAHSVLGDLTDQGNSEQQQVIRSAS